MSASAIEWTQVTWNPTTGCDRISPGCNHCYALTLAKRLKAMHQPKYQNDGDPCTSGPGFALTLHQDVLQLPYSWRTPTTVFVNSMSDLFHEDVPLDFIRSVFDVMEATPQHTYQVLTKRSQRLVRVADELPWPSNVWRGVSVETQNYAFRARHLKQVPAAVHFLSVEPLLGPVSLDLDGIDWVIVGGESGHGARPLDPSWVRAIRDACATRGIPFFFKQWGGAHSKGKWARARWPALGRDASWSGASSTSVKQNPGTVGEPALARALNIDQAVPLKRLQSALSQLLNSIVAHTHEFFDCTDSDALASKLL